MRFRSNGLLTRRMALLGAASLIAFPALAETGKDKKRLEDHTDFLYVPSRPEIVDAMLKLAEVTSEDLVLDLGSGDGRIPIAAALNHGARGRGVELIPDRVELARNNARNANVEHLVEFRQEDIFETEISDATVVTMYLFGHTMRQMQPRLQKELKPGTRIVTHQFTMGADWPPDRSEQVGNARIHLWTVT